VIKKLLTVVGMCLALAGGASTPTVTAAGAEPACGILNCW
jgi:hypothetical protein